MSFSTAVSFVGYISLANLALDSTSVATYLIARSLTLPATYLITLYYFRDPVPPMKTISVLIVFIGFFIGNSNVNGVAIAGVVLGSLSSIMQVGYSVRSKEVQSEMKCKNNLMLFVSIWSFLIFIPILTLFESPVMATQELIGLSPLHIGLVSVSCSAGILISYSVFTIVHNLGPLAYEIAGFFKGALQSMLGVFCLGDEISNSSSVSICFILVASLVYSCDELIASTVLYTHITRFVLFYQNKCTEAKIRWMGNIVSSGAIDEQVHHIEI
eukprot:GHVH01001111.1.p1 GENE.GHVH01001111.1~~GHVH01001111.1.p1  ORF type:complete len:271 (+),score=9.08 GHVH01001111.1:377-1189(+)